ncbi:hypothetical protein KP509_12G030100 [Ceratopteris richardii]|nr:hypothetical protein KP509_12G030100 [Ceratopteris richardii]
MSDAVSLIAALKACATEKNLQKGSNLHALITKTQLHINNLHVGSALINMYAKCGALEKAQETFDGLPKKNVVLWNALITGYVHHEQYDKALQCFDQMRSRGFSADGVTFSCILKSCGSLGDLERGQALHTEIVGNPQFERDVLVGTALVDMYAKCGALGNAQEVFDGLTERNVITWTALIAGYVQHGHGEEALNCFELMKCAGFSPNAITFSCCLKACGIVGDLQKGKEIHAQMLKENLMDKHVLAANAVVDMYAKCGDLKTAQDVFDNLHVRDVVSWNTLITGYAQRSFAKEALSCFDLMLSDGFLPNRVTYASILKACGSLGALERGQEVHAQILKHLALENDIQITNVLIDMYAKSGAFDKAHKLIDEASSRDVVSWTSLITGYIDHGLGEGALNCYEQMQLEGLVPDAITFACIIKACCAVGIVVIGQGIHCNIVQLGYSESTTDVSTALINMYASFGLLSEAQYLFNSMPLQDISTWSALMAGYSQLGKDADVFCLHEKMIAEGTRPDAITLTIILNACNHKGRLDKGEMYFEVVSSSFGIIPNSDHYTCMIDMYGRAGQLHQAAAVINQMPLSASVTMWVALFDSSRKDRKAELEDLFFEDLDSLYCFGPESCTNPSFYFEQLGIGSFKYY